MTDPPPTPHCRTLTHPSPPTILLAAVLLLGILLSYLPQHIKIISRRTSEGLSPWWVLLGGLSSIAAIGNILTLPASREDVKCCREISGGACAAALLGVGQIGCQWGCFMFIVMLYLIFFPTTTPSSSSDDDEPPDRTTSLTSLNTSSTPKRRDALLVGLLTLLALLLTTTSSLILTTIYPNSTQAFANLLGTIAGALATIQYVPQIWYTYRLTDVKSLSVVTMLIQVPGAFLFAFSLWQRVGWGGWSTWLVYIITGILQGCLLGLAVYYYMHHRRAEKKIGDGDVFSEVDNVDGARDGGAEDGGMEDAPDERTTLLNGGGSANGGGRGRNSKGRPIAGSTRKSSASQRQLSMLYAATPPEHDSDRSSSGR